MVICMFLSFVFIIFFTHLICQTMCFFPEYYAIWWCNAECSGNAVKSLFSMWAVLMIAFCGINSSLSYPSVLQFHWNGVFFSYKLFYRCSTHVKLQLFFLTHCGYRVIECSCGRKEAGGRWGGWWWPQCGYRRAWRCRVPKVTREGGLWRNKSSVNSRIGGDRLSGPD